MPEYMCRICWNSQDWRRPSGDGAAMEGQKTFLSKYGFGHEEWLFDGLCMADGWQYGFLQSLERLNAAGRQAMERSGATLHLFTRTPGKVFGLFAQIQDAWVPTAAEVQTVLATRRADLFARRVADLRWALGPKYRERALQKLEEETVGAALINVKFRPEQVLLFDRPLELNLNPKARYQTRKWSHTFLTAAPEELDAVPALDAESEPGRVLRRGVSDRLVELTHQRVQLRMLRWLQQTYPGFRVSREQQRVDLTMTGPKHRILIEIKTMQVARECIREALGQLLEYNHHGVPGGTQGQELVIVGPKVQTETDSAYLKWLRSNYRLPIAYATYDAESGVIHGWKPGDAIVKKMG